MNTLKEKDALDLLLKYNSDRFHLRHAMTVKHVMAHFARELGYEDEADFWGLVGLLHDVDWEKYPEEHCRKAPELLAEIDAPDELARAVASHGWEICADVEPEHMMEKVLYATDELTGLIYAYSLMRPSGSVQDMKLKSLKKKYKDKKFAAGVNRDIVERGAAMLGWDMDTLLTRTMDAMAETEDAVEKELAALA